MCHVTCGRCSLAYFVMKKAITFWIVIIFWPGLIDSTFMRSLTSNLQKETVSINFALSQLLRIAAPTKPRILATSPWLTDGQQDEYVSWLNKIQLSNTLKSKQVKSKDLVDRLNLYPPCSCGSCRSDGQSHRNWRGWARCLDIHWNIDAQI